MTVSKISALQSINRLFSTGKTKFVPQFAANNEGTTFNFANGEFNLTHPRHGGYEGATKALKLDYSA